MEQLSEEQSRPRKGRRLISWDGLRDKGITYSKAQLWRKIKDKKFPQPVSGAGKETSWVEDEIDQHVAELIAGRANG